MRLRCLLLSHIRKPVARRRTFAFGNLEEDLLNARRQLAPTSGTDRDPIDGTDRSDLRSRATEKEFIGDIERSPIVI